MNVILDTSIIVSDYYMKSANFKILFDYSKKIPFEIFIPEVVYDEVKNKYKEQFESQLISYEKSISKIKPLLLGRNIDFLSFDINLQEESYIDYLDDMLKNKKFTLLPYPKTTHKNIVLHELSRKKPFKSNGSGYRDKLIIDSIFEKFISPNEEIIFISNNSNDFGEEPNLHQDIFYGKKETYRSKYTIKNTLANFIKDYIDPIKHIDENIKTIPQLSQVVGIDLGNWILNNLKDIIYDNEVGYAIVGLETGFGTVMLHKTDTINKLVISDVIQMDDRIITCKILIDANLIMYISGDQDDFNSSKSWSEFFEYNPSEGHVDVSTWQSTATILMISIVIDSKNKQIISYEPMWVNGETERIYYNW